jgi:drug/metabolite transporter (DMT)-like permease
MAVNAEEAKHSSLFVAGWRPFIGWCCGFAVAYQYVITPLALWIAAISGFHLPTPPRLDDILWELMFGMLGMGALRSFDKIKGTAK